VLSERLGGHVGPPLVGGFPGTVEEVEDQQAGAPSPAAPARPGRRTGGTAEHRQAGGPMVTGDSRLFCQPGAAG
jgi:hypothetical protein